ncbi:hypothetical protein BDR26DRAFT_1002723 [Obelidium mucronatum]|nr:hypothetical protein BDR26DRAFT_1002723 [Obelidium mucronatum]
MDATDLDSTPEAGAAMGGTSEVITESPDDQSKPVEEIEAPTSHGTKYASNDEVESVGATRTPENESASAASNLSPEVFHKHQPAATPLKRGDRRAPNDCPIAPGSVTKIPCTPGGSILKSALRRTLHHTASSPSKITKSGTPGSGLTVAQSSLKSASSKLKFSTPSNHSRAGVPMTTSKIPSSTVGFMTPKIGLPTTMSAMTVSPKKSLRDAFKYLPPAISGSGKTGFYGSTSIAAAVTTKTTVPTPTALDVAETPVKYNCGHYADASQWILLQLMRVLDARPRGHCLLLVDLGLDLRPQHRLMEAAGEEEAMVGLDTPSSLTGRVRDSLAENTSPSCFVAAAVDNAVVVADGNGSVAAERSRAGDSDALILEDAVNQEISDAVDDVAAEMGSSEETAVDATQSGDLIEENHTLNEVMCDIDTVHDVAVVECEDDSRSNMATIAPSESLAESTHAVDLEAEFGDEDDTDIANVENLGGLVSPSSMALVEVAEREFDNDNEKTTNALDAQNDMVDCVMAESGMTGQKLVETAESMNPTEDRADDSDESEYEDVQVEVEVEVSMDENELAAVQVVVAEADVVAEGDDSMVDCAAVADTAEVLLVETTKPLELETGDEMVGVQDTAVQDTVQNTVVQATTVQDTSLDTADGECHFERLQGDCETVRAMDSTDNEELTALIAPAAGCLSCTRSDNGRIPAAGHDDQHPSTVSPHHSQPVNSVAKVVELTEVEKTTPAPPRKRATRRSVRKLDVAAENVENGEMNCDPVAADSLFGPDEEIILLRPSSRCRSRTTSMDIALQVSEVIEQTDTEAGDILPAATVQTVVSPSPAPSIAIVSTGAKRKGKSAKHAHQFPVASFYKETSGLSSSEAKACGVAGEANLGVSVEDSAKPDGRSANNSGEHAMEVETIEKRDVEGADSQETLNHHDLRHRKDGEAPEAILPSDHKRRGRREAASKSSHSVAEDSEEVKMEPPKSGKRGGIRAAAPVNVLEESGDVHPKKKGRPAKQTPHVTTPHATTTNEVIYISEDEHVAAAPEAALEKPKKRGRPAKKTVEAVEVEPVVETIIASDTKPRHPPRSGRKQAQKVEEEKLDDEAGDIPVVLKSSRKGAKTNVAEVPSETVDEAKPSKRGGKAKNIHATPVEVLDASVGKDDAVVEEKKTGRSARSKRA